MGFAWFTYTIVLMVVTTAACAVNLTLWVLTSRRDGLAAAAGFLLYVLDTGVILYDEYQRSKPIASDYLDAGLTHPVFQILVSCLLVTSVWLWCSLHVGNRPKPARATVLVLAFLVASALAAPVGEAAGVVRTMAYWGLRDVAVIAAICWLGAQGNPRGSAPLMSRHAQGHSWYVLALVLALLVLCEDVANIVFFRPDLSVGWVHDLLWHLTERNLSENALVLVCAVASVVQARHAARVFARHPTQSEERLSEERVRPEFETRLLTFADEHGMSAREREVLELVLKGRDNQAIASALVISTGTVKAHLSRMYRKAGVSSRDELVGAFWRG